MTNAITITGEFATYEAKVKGHVNGGMNIKLPMNNSQGADVGDEVQVFFRIMKKKGKKK